MQASFKLSSIARGCVAAAALTTALAAQAAVQAPLSETVDGALNEPAYGPGGAGFAYEMLPFLAIKGLGTPALPTSVVALNPALSFDYEISGAGTSLMTVEYTITNKSLTESFSDVSFWVIANPDGDQVDFLDRVTEAWGAAAPKDPVRRQTGQFDDIPNLHRARRPVGRRSGAVDALPDGHLGRRSRGGDHAVRHGRGRGGAGAIHLGSDGRGRRPAGHARPAPSRLKRRTHAGPFGA